MGTSDLRVSTLFVIPLTQFLVGVLLFVALLHGHGDLTILTLLVLGLAMGTNLWSRMSLSRVRCHSTLDKHKLFPGESLSLEVKAENNHTLPLWLRVVIHAEGLFPPSSQESDRSKESGLLWRQEVSFRWSLVAPRRGVFRAGPVLLQAGDLFGFYPRERALRQEHEVLIYPRLVPLKPFLFPRRDFFGIPGAQSPVQDPIYILGTRDYQHGQPARFIHWKASARHHRLQEKLFESTEQEKILFGLDVSPFAGHRAADDFERVLETIASLAVTFDRQGCSIGLATNGSMTGGNSPFLPVARGPHQLPALLEMLARIRMEREIGLIEMLRQGPQTTWGASCIFFSYHEDEGTHAADEYFKRRRIPVVFFVCRPGDPSRSLPVRSGPSIHTLEALITQEVSA